MAHPILSSVANFIVGTQPSHIVRHYQRYLGERSLAYPIYASLAAYFAYRLWQVWSYDPNAVVSPEYEGQHVRGGQHQRSYDTATSANNHTLYNNTGTDNFVGRDKNEYANNSQCEESFKALWNQVDTKNEEIEELRERITALEKGRQHTGTSHTTRRERGYSDIEREKTNRTRYYAALTVNSLAVLFAANWSFAPLWKSAHFITILGVLGGEFTYYLSPANEKYRAKCQFDRVDGNLQKFCVALLHSPFVHSLDQMIGDKLGNFARIETDYSRQ